MRVRLLSILLGLLPVFLQAQVENPARVFRELRALDGVWFMPTDRGDRLEIWSITNDSTLTGRLVRIRQENGDTITLESRSLELRRDTIRYIAVVRGQNNNKAIPFTLTKADYDGYLFENPANDDPKKITYILLGNREIQVNTEGVRGSRTVSQEYVFEREFSPSSVQFRLRAGANVFTMRQTGTLLAKPEYKPRPGWELGSTLSFKGRGGYITLNVDLGLLGKDVYSKSNFATVQEVDTGDVFLFYERDLTYRQIWLGLGVYPEITFWRDGWMSAYAGPYVARLLSNRASGVDLPADDGLYKDLDVDASFDHKRTDIGVIAGLQFKFDVTKKDLDGILGLRANLGLANVDNLYTRGCNNSAYCNGRVGLQGLSVYYSVNLQKF